MKQSKLVLAIVAAMSAVILAALAGPYSVISLVDTDASVMTNNAVGSSEVARPILIPASTVAMQAKFRLMSAGTGTVSVNLQKSYDGTNWQAGVLMTVAASGTNFVEVSTNATIADFGYVRCLVTNAGGATMTNLTLNLFHK